MSKELEYADAFLRHTHPEKEGWVLSRNCNVGEHLLQYVFHKADVYTLVVLRIQGPVATKAHLRMAQTIQQACMAKFGAHRVRVLMVYGQLLTRLGRLPKDVSIMSVIEETDDSLEDDLYDVCPN